MFRVASHTFSKTFRYVCRRPFCTLFATAALLYTTHWWLAADSLAHIKLRVGKDGYITLNIPQKYIGPSNIDLPDVVLRATEPVNMIPLAFTYPDFKPLKSVFWRRLLNEPEPENEVMLLLTGGGGEKRGLNGYVYWVLDFNMKDKRCHAEPYPGTIYNLHRYKRFYDCLTPNKYHAEDIYFYDAPGDSEDDALIHCPPPWRKTEKCRFEVNIDQAGIVQADFSAEQKFLPNWQKVVGDYKNFITPFYASEIASMKKPRPLTEAEIRDIRRPEEEKWKP